MILLNVVREVLVVQVPREDEDDLRWIRTGWIDQSRWCDEVARYAFSYIKGSIKPQYWAENWPWPEQTNDLEWSVTASYHLLWVHGQPVLRIWTNTAKKATVELSDLLANHKLTKELFEVQDIPAGTLKKRPEFRKKVYVKTLSELVFILELTKRMYGLESR